MPGEKAGLKREINMDDVKISEKKEVGMTDLQIYGIKSTVITLLSKVRKYTLLTQIQMDLIKKSHQVQPIMREIYQFEETKMIMDIRADYDMFYVYATDKIVMKNVEMLREFFEQSIGFITTNMQTVNSILDKNYAEILDTFIDKLQHLSTNIATKSIFDEHFKIS